MSDAIEHIDVDHEDFESAPKALREHVKNLQAALKERDKIVSDFRSRETERALSDVLTGFKNPGRVQRDLLADKVDPLDTEAVNKWLEDNAGDYARGEGAAAEAPAEQASPDATLAAQYARLQPTGIRKPSDNQKAEAIASLPDDLTAAQVEQRLRELGA